MPSVVVEVCRSYPPETETAMLEAVHGCIVEAFRVLPTHRNATLVVHAPHRMLGRTDSPDPTRTTHVSLFVLPGRSLAAKRRLYRLIVEALEGFGIPPACVLIKLHELPAENIGARGGRPVADVELGYPLDV